MNALMLELSMDALVSPGVSTESVAAEVRVTLALKLFEVGRLSSARLANCAAWGE